MRGRKRQRKKVLKKFKYSWPEWRGPFTRKAGPPGTSLAGSSVSQHFRWLVYDNVETDISKGGKA